MSSKEHITGCYRAIREHAERRKTDESDGAFLAVFLIALCAHIDSVEARIRDTTKAATYTLQVAEMGSVSAREQAIGLRERIDALEIEVALLRRDREGA